MSNKNLTETAPDERGERVTPSQLAPLPQETRRRSIQPGILRQNSMHSMINNTYSE